MHNLSFKHYLYAACLLILASILSLWSWNTLAELLSFPEAQYKHVVAAFFLLVILRFGLIPGHQWPTRK